MTEHEHLPAALAELFPIGQGDDRTLAVAIPPGRTIFPDEGDGPRPVIWMSDGPAPAGLWPDLHAAHRTSGLWPMLLEDLDGDSEEFRPWGSGELFPDGKSRPGDYEPRALLSELWARGTVADQDLESYLAARGGPLTPQQTVSAVDADACAAGCAESLLRTHPRLRIGLVPADRGADAPTAAGWDGPVNFVNDTAKISAVLRDWEDRFGVRLVAAGFATLYLSVLAPPTTIAEATRVAAEHLAFCPDTVGSFEEIPEYAKTLVDRHSWTFWWD